MRVSGQVDLSAWNLDFGPIINADALREQITEAIENSLDAHEPFLSVEETETDIDLVLSMDAFGIDGGPNYEFSLSGLITAAADGNPERASEIRTALLHLAQRLADEPISPG